MFTQPEERKTFRNSGFRERTGSLDAPLGARPNWRGLAGTNPRGSWGLWRVSAIRAPTDFDGEEGILVLPLRQPSAGDWLQARPPLASGRKKRLKPFPELYRSSLGRGNSVRGST